MDIGSTNEELDAGGLLPEVRINQEKMMEKIIEPQIPKGMTDEEVDGVRNQAVELVDRLVEANGNEELESLKALPTWGFKPRPMLRVSWIC